MRGCAPNHDAWYSNEGCYSSLRSE
jgi:hypothetical protein